MQRCLLRQVLSRLGLSASTSQRSFSPEELLPACGQGALAVQCRRERCQATLRPDCSGLMTM
jgi:porphobilinogen deaminase